MNIVLIGHEGYLGKSIFSYLSKHHRVIGWDVKENLFNLSAGYLAREKIETVINLAVVADRGSKRYQAGAPTDEINVMGARHLARELKGTDIAWFQLSTREVLGPVYKRKDVIKTKGGFRPKFLVNEECPYAPQNFYGKSKLMAEFISETHPRSNVIRLTTCYSDFDHLNGNWMVDLIRACAHDRPVTLTQGGHQFRDPLHAHDLARLIETLCERNVFQETFHAGGGEHNMISLREFVLAANPKARITTADGGDFGFAFDHSKATRLAGWEPQIRVRDKIPLLLENIRRGATE